MLIGTYEHNLDGKNRVFIPAKFRDELGETVYYTFHSSKYPSIQLYSKQGFEEALEEALLEAKDRTERRNIRAEFMMGAGEATYDSQGRVVLNPLSTRNAGIEKQCIFVGFVDYVEVMSPENYNKYLETITLNNTLDEEAIESEKKILRSYKSEGKLLGLQEK